MSAVRYPIKDQTAIAGVASPPYVRDAGRTATAMVVDACIGAIRDAGLTGADIDGISGSHIAPAYAIQAALGLPSITWWCNPIIPFQHQVVEAMNAVYAGICSTVLCYHGTYRAGGTSRSAAVNPFRARYGPGLNVLSPTPDTLFGPVGYAAWAARYLHDYGLGREILGMVAINDRSNAVTNPHAALRSPLTMEEYLEARMVREPLSILDMDYPVDGADAFIITTAERARDLAKRPVLIHAAVMGETGLPYEDQTVDLDHTGQQIVVEQLWRRSDVRLDDVDIFFPYDGFSIITVRWFETIGYCGNGEALGFFLDNWDKQTDRLQVNGRVLVNTHGGSLSDGGTQGSGHFREAVLQLRGEEGARQSPGVKTALLTPGGLFFNSGGVVLRTE
ncbi:MAG TPA: thiolase family protein [Acidimicrobiales bacterium]|nr:thiolase family protein [Acidimicrobiales bacterium]